MTLKSLILSAGLVMGAMSASAATIITDCGIVTDGEASTCNGAMVNVAVDDTQFAFEATVADDATSGSLSVDTFVNPFYSTAYSGANVLVELAADYSVYDDASVVLSFGTETSVLSLIPGTNTFAGSMITAFFSEVDQIIPLSISWAGFEGGEQVSMRITAVPLPAGVLLLGTALGGLGLARRRRKLAA